MKPYAHSSEKAAAGYRTLEATGGRRWLPAMLSGAGAILALSFLVVLPLLPSSSASSGKTKSSTLAAGTVTVKLTGQFVASPTDTFTLTKQVFTGSTDCSAGGGSSPTVPNVNSTTGHSFSITAADSVILTAPPFSDGNGQFLSWMSSTATITPIPGTNGRQVCVQGFDDATHIIEARYAPGIQTFDSTCTTVKMLFDVGETVCVKVVGAAPTAMQPWNVIMAGGTVNECGSFFSPQSITAETQTVTFTLPAINAEIPPACTTTTDIRGNWRTVLRSFTNTNRAQKNFRLRDPNNPAADVSISKFLTDNQSYPPNGFAHYRISVQNNGPDSASNVTVTENVPANTTFVSWTQISGPTFMLGGPSGGDVTATIASLAADAVANFELVVQIDNGVADGTQIDNTVSVTSSTTDLLPNNNSATEPIIVSTNACQLLCPANITVPDMGAPGEVVNFSDPTTIGAGSCGSIMCTPASGSTFPAGTTTVTCFGLNQGFCTFTVTVGAPCILTCPANITMPNDPGQCNAVVTFAPMSSGPCGTITCNPPSGSAFFVGTTTVTCTPSMGTSCSFTVTVNDTENPSFTSCPMNIGAISSQGCASSSGSVVTFATPQATDNCGGLVVSCVPPSGSTFPAGTTTVTCTATDGAGLTATCSFTVTVFGACLKDDSNSGNVVLFNPSTGEYRFCCNGVVIASGIGAVTRSGCNVTIQHNLPDRRVLIKSDTSSQKGTASIHKPVGVLKCSITDKNLSSGACMCQ